MLRISSSSSSAADRFDRFFRAALFLEDDDDDDEDSSIGLWSHSDDLPYSRSEEQLHDDLIIIRQPADYLEDLLQLASEWMLTGDDPDGNLTNHDDDALSSMSN